MDAVRIQDLPRQERPRERFLRLGPSALSDVELLAILLGTGAPGMDALELARRLIARFDSLAGLARSQIGQLERERGIGPAKAIHLSASFELGSRLARERVSRERIDRPERVYDLLGAEMRALRVESLRVILLDTRYRLLRLQSVSTGSVNESIAHPREIFEPAILHGAYAMILAHNHPSGDPTPSEADRRLTRRLAEGAAILQIELLDHVILGAPREDGPGYFSFKESGLL